MKKICFYNNDEGVKEYFSKELDDIVFLKGEVQDYQEIDGAEEIEVASCFTASTFDKENIDKFPNLRMIATRSTGFDHIDLDYCQEKGIVVSNVPAYGANTVAEFAFSLLMAISRKTFASYEKVRHDMNFSRRGTDEIKGFDLRGKTIGIIGTGRIGRYAVAIAHGFGMNILASDPHPQEDLVNDYGVKYVELNDLLAQSDIIDIHVPLCPATQHMLNSDNIPLIKPGAVLINTSRGEVVDTVILRQALEDGIISAAGLDVLECEGGFGREVAYEKIDECARITEINKELVKMENVIVTPHNAFNTTEAIERIWDTTVENIKSFERGEVINHVVKK